MTNKRWESVEFVARDGVKLVAKKIVPVSNKSLTQPILLFLHGGSFNSRHYVTFAEQLKNFSVLVFLLDMRGHGDSEGIRGNTNYIGQLEDDLEDIIKILHIRYPDSKLLIGGHSSGAVVLLRYLYKYNVTKIDGFIFIAPALTALELIRYNQPAHRLLYKFNYYRSLKHYVSLPKGAEKQVPRINFSKALLAKLFPCLRRKIKILTFPGDYKIAAIEKRVLEYTYNMMASCTLSINYQDVLHSIRFPSLFLIGSDDEILNPLALKITLLWNISPFVPVKFYEISNANHINICNQCVPVLTNWLSQHGFILKN